MKLITIVSLFTVTVLFSSCEALGLTTPSMDSERAVARILDAYEKHVDTLNYKPINIMWYEDETLSNELSMLNITMIAKDNKAYSQSFKIGGDRQKAYEMEESRFNSYKNLDFATVTWIRPSDINAKMIVNHLNGASEYVREGYSLKSVSSYTVSANQSKGEIGYFFNINVIEKEDPENQINPMMQINYYEMPFEGFTDGTSQAVS